MNTRKLFVRLLAVFICAALISFVAVGALAQDDGTGDTAAETTVVEESSLTAEDVQTNLDLTWVLLAGFLVFFMQAGFAMLEGGFIRHTGVVNSMVENFMDATLTGVAFFAVGYGIAFGATNGGLFGTDLFFLNGANGTNPGDGSLFVGWFFQFAFAGAAGTIATGAMAERTAFWGKIIYSVLLGLFIYPVVVHWVWQGEGWLTGIGFLDFAGSTVVHQTGGIIALMGAILVGTRYGRVFGSPPRPHNLMIATLGTFILWFGWYGFNVGSTLGAGDPNIMGLVAVNTTLAACTGTLGAMFFMYLRAGHWDLGFVLNGSLAGLVAITAGCAFVAPGSALIIGALAGALVVMAVEVVERMKVDDAVGAFAVHGVCGMFGTLAIGLFGVPALTGGAGGLLVGGGVEQLGVQAVGVIAVAIWASVTSGVMFYVLKVLGLLRISEEAAEVGIDVHEHSATVWPDVLPFPEEAPSGAGD